MSDLAPKTRGSGGSPKDAALKRNKKGKPPAENGNSGPKDAKLSSEVEKMWTELNGMAQKITFDKDDKPSAAKLKPKRSETFQKRAEKRLANRVAQQKVDEIPRPIDSKLQPAAQSSSVKTAGNSKPKRKGAKLSTVIDALEHPGNLLVEEQWDSYVSKQENNLPLDLIPALKDKAHSLLLAENDVYHAELIKTRDYTQSVEFLRSGTFQDQLGTLSLLITQSPLHSIRFLDQLLQKCESKNRESASKALEVARDLLTSHVMPDRRLTWFRDHTTGLRTDNVQALIVYAFEDWLKTYLFKILQVMERLLSDQVEQIRLRTLYCLFGFFQAKPEQESNLLRLAINKFGDSSPKVCSRVKSLLNSTLEQHPSMQGVIAAAVAEFLARAGEYNAKYYAMDALSEFVLRKDDPSVPNVLIKVYLSLFQRLLAEWNLTADKGRAEKDPVKKFKQKKDRVVEAQKKASQADDERNARLVAKIFSGLNRAFPYSNLDNAVYEEHMDMLYRMSHSPNVGTFIEALTFIFQLARRQKSTKLDRYYRTLYDSLLDLRLYQSSKLDKYLSLLLKSTSVDKEEYRSRAFAKRIGQVATQWPEVGSVAALCHIAVRVATMDKLLEDGQLSEEFDFKQRDPKFAKAETTKLWEATLLVNHYHPTVAIYADNILRTQRQQLDMPKIDDFGIANFLSKWSYKTPKERKTQVQSIFEPLSGYTDLGFRGRSRDQTSLPLVDWSKRKITDLAPHERFFYDYFKARPAAAGTREKLETEFDSEAEEDEIFKAIMRSNPDEVLDDGDANDGDLNEEQAYEKALRAAFASDNDDAHSQSDDSFDGFEDVESDEEETEPSGGSRKRKRAWDGMPEFMDVDEFEESLRKRGHGSD